jgi:hypothetical protein
MHSTHYTSTHIAMVFNSLFQCCTSYAVVQYIALLMMGILMPETCWDKERESTSYVLHLVRPFPYLVCKTGWHLIIVLLWCCDQCRDFNSRIVFQHMYCAVVSVHYMVTCWYAIVCLIWPIDIQKFHVLCAELPYTTRVNFQQFYCTFCPHSIFMCFVWIWEQRLFSCTALTDWLVYPRRVYCAVRTEHLTLTDSTFCPHSVFMFFFVDLRTNSDYFPIQHVLTQLV